jgi:hypothetical protein
LKSVIYFEDKTLEPPHYGSRDSVVGIIFFLIYIVGGWNQGPLDTAAT